MSPTFRFIPAMYRAAIVDLIKNQTRRVISRLPCQCSDQQWIPQEMCNTTPEGWQTTGHSGRWWCECCTSADEAIESTYGPPGMVLPVVTTWAVHRYYNLVKPRDMQPEGIPYLKGIWWDDGTPKPEWAGKSRPAMFFPKHLYPLARQARVVSVKAERVQSISAADAIAEGVRAVQFPGRHPDGGDWLGFHNYQFETAHPKSGIVITDDQHRIEAFASPVESYRTLWDSINQDRGKGLLKGQYAWKRNPWVFATTFEVLPE